MSLKKIYYNFGGEISKCCIFKNEANRKCPRKNQRKKLPIVPFFKLCSEEKIIFFLDFSFIFLTIFFFSKLLFFVKRSKSQIWTFLKCPKSILTTSNNVPKWGVPFFRWSLKKHILLNAFVLTLILVKNILSKVSNNHTFVTLPFSLFYKIRLK